MTLDIHMFIKDKGGDPEVIRESQRKRGHSVEVVDEVIAMYEEWVKQYFQLGEINKKINAVQKEITAKKKAKEDASEFMGQKVVLDTQQKEQQKVVADAEIAMKIKAGGIGNLIYKDVPVSDNEDNNEIIRKWAPQDHTGETPNTIPDCLAHHEVMLRLGAVDLERGANVAGHRGYYLTGPGVRLNQALINYGLDFLEKRNFLLMQPPFFMHKDAMARTAQLDEFDEALYKVSGDEIDKYLIATSEQPISAYHMNEWFEAPAKDLPLRYGGYSTCFRKEAGSSGRDVWGIFRVHQFEKVEQFCITEPEKSWEMFEEMVGNSEAFYQSLGLPYRLVAIVSGALNLAAAKKYDLEAWFPYQQAYKELVSTSNCTDYQSRKLEVRCGLKKTGDTKKVYVHMLNGTLCATERALCCLVENYQTPEGLRIPEVLQPYMGGKDFLPFIRELPKNYQRKK
ncbi:Serine--tRNA ligase, cytoplasmic; AltName: Full=Seryl-tRNA synthetase; Short=SerRS; AltName: Full=Seryl-tRNA(Ser/Sec) synthetase [Serendipita indica DSM 11827]|nr:Serine--tRNA ligase, cytoplasmic; AltName: Full=Seryl-tRNA synthetase; Short=SerRS; AltName: Full=Seryl-tRNA(Ser/Sec) synthetase [Serendipita indica DSM 11827]